MGVWQWLSTSFQTDSEFAYATQMQLDHARQVLPCIDNPAFKATFDVTLTHPAHYTPISSGRLEHSTDEPSTVGWTTSVFERTPMLPTYVLAMDLLPPSYAIEQAVTGTGRQMNVHGLHFPTSSL
jgi:aminopeptidase N